jgi:peptidoglycan/xylan/chitin deacetylase (PgdA/CDA1 family)
MSRRTHVAFVAFVTFIALALLSTALPWGGHAVASGKLPPEDATPTVRPRPPTATPRPRPLPALARVPILMYHRIEVPPLGADKYRIDLSAPPISFERQLQYLSANSYKTISLADIYDHLSTGKPLPPKPVVLTFDDGYRDAYTAAFPLLKKYRMIGTFFITTDFINYKNPDHLTWPMVREMANSGMSIESHARTHRDLRGVGNAVLVWELLGPVEQISYYTGKKPRFFAYPSGRYDANVMGMLRQVSTLAAVTTEHGAVQSLGNALLWPRLRVHGRATIDQFAALLK